MRRNVVGTVLELGSSAAITAGVTMLLAPLGWIVGGSLGLVFAWRLAR